MPTSLTSRKEWHIYFFFSAILAWFCDHHRFTTAFLTMLNAICAWEKSYMGEVLLAALSSQYKPFSKQAKQD